MSRTGSPTGPPTTLQPTTLQPTTLQPTGPQPTGAQPTLGMPGLRVAADTHVGKVRQQNEDSFILEPTRGLYAVLDGMGGANAGDIASQTARDAVRDFVQQRRLTLAPKALLEAAIQAATAAVFNAAQEHRELSGMGTTVVACLVVDTKHVVIAHVGDSRAYLHRGGRLTALTKDHTIVEELVERGLVSAAEAEHHPYKNVLSRNIGARADTKVDLLELELQPGDRLMLCSDGLYGYASTDAIQYILGSGDAPDHVTRDLIELALRGGGGDNVTAIVIEAPAQAQTTTQVVRTSGAIAWWQKRARFLQVAKDRGLVRNALVRGLEPDEALELVGESLCQAVFHDLEKSTGVNVWTFAQNLATGWFERGGEWAPVRAMIDILSMAARTVVDEIRATDGQLGFLLDVAVSRALVVAELALGGLLAERLRQVDAGLIQLATAQHETVDQTAPPSGGAADRGRATFGEDQSAPSGELDASSGGDGFETGERFIDRPTVPFLRADRAPTSSGETDEVMAAISNTLTIARARVAPKHELVKQVMTALETVATERSGNFAIAVIAARELYGQRPADDAGVMPLYDALDQARILVASAAQQIQATEGTRARALRAVSAAHQRVVGATTGLVLEGVAPFSDKLREVQATTARLRDQVAQAERKRALLERRAATIVDPEAPWGARGNTEW